MATFGGFASEPMTVAQARRRRAFGHGKVAWHYPRTTVVRRPLKPWRPRPGAFSFKRGLI
jgi:hypothetical protein